jgi:hypothetical protein
VDHPFLFVPAQDYVAQFLMTFKDYPQRQKAASFNLDEVLEKVREPPAASKRSRGMSIGHEGTRTRNPKPVFVLRG